MTMCGAQLDYMCVLRYRMNTAWGRDGPQTPFGSCRLLSLILIINNNAKEVWSKREKGGGLRKEGREEIVGQASCIETGRG